MRTLKLPWTPIYHSFTTGTGVFRPRLKCDGKASSFVEEVVRIGSKQVMVHSKYEYPGPMKGARVAPLPKLVSTSMMCLSYVSFLLFSMQIWIPRPNFKLKNKGERTDVGTYMVWGGMDGILEMGSTTGHPETKIVAIITSEWVNSSFSGCSNHRPGSWTCRSIRRSPTLPLGGGCDHQCELSASTSQESTPVLE